jgi:hypothetical protein
MIRPTILPNTAERDDRSNRVVVDPGAFRAHVVRGVKAVVR